MRGHETDYLPTHLQVRDIGVEIDPIQALQIQRYLPVEDVVDRHRGGHDRQPAPLPTPLTSDPVSRQRRDLPEGSVGPLLNPHLTAAISPKKTTHLGGPRLASLDESDTALARLASAFDAEHERLFSFLLNVDHELVNARATVSGPSPEVAPLTLPEGDGNPGAAVVGTKPIHLSGERVDARIYDRAKLLAGDVIAGPAIITEMDSTTLVLPGHAATVHRSGSLLIRPTA
ncbi:MAG TPA: hypothetical protein VK735_45890 [Pseudonocardia sp.]|uniref:hypothetical protein n=1 Tax=Pseudonocardia sp. TaxID=60912 RepID=UPI002CB6095C|nr:hypothetical protein [Pseudonocardia sp.]HTF54821.1 hypothetical protein [Pseudonocardia sp.]